MPATPKLDSRSAEQVFAEVADALGQRPGVDARGVDPMAEALLRVFARYCEVLIERLNRVPDKTYLAFLNTLNLSRMPPRPAQVPLTFSLVKQTPPTATVIVPAYTAVAGTPGPGADTPVVFETTRELALSHVTLEKIVTLDPKTDRWADRSGLASRDGGRGEFLFAADTPVAHELYLRQDRIFGGPPMTRLRIRLTIPGGAAHAPGPLAVEWRMLGPKGDVVLKPLQDSTSGLTTSGDVVFGNLPQWPEYDLFGRPGRWLACRLLTPLPVSDAAAGDQRGHDQPRIQRVDVSARWEVDESPVVAAFATSAPLDLTRDFFPFGERPRFNDVFYVASDGFGHPGSSVALNVTLTNPASGRGNRSLPRAGKDGQPVLKWEYWNGRQWTELVVRDETEGLTENGAVLFTVPASMAKVAVSGEEHFWIRARLMAGHYGQDERIEFTEGGVVRRIPSTLAPPSIQSIVVSSWSSAGPAAPEAMVTHNNFELDAVDNGVEFSPFRRAGHRSPAVYLGFKVPDEDAPDAVWGAARAQLALRLGQPDFDTWIKPLRVADHTPTELRLKVPNESVRAYVLMHYLGAIEETIKTLAGPGIRVAVSVHNVIAERAIDLYCHLQTPREGRVYLEDGSGETAPRLIWQYWNGRQWRDATVADTTGSLMVSGVLTLRAGSDAMPWSSTSLGRDLYWLRVLWSAGEFGSVPEMTRMAVNTVMATQTLTLQDELLGSSTGKPRQMFRTARAPVLSEVHLEVRELDMPGRADPVYGRVPGAVDTATLPRQGREPEDGVWVRWQEVNDWLSSTHEDRHYVVNRETGEIAFGDDVHGRIPPRGTNNVRVHRYQTGGGAAGNQPAGAIAQLRKTVPYVDAVVNLEPAVGGQDPERSEALAERGSRWLRHRDRAVTAEDYEDLAKLASPRVAMAKCYACEDRAREPLGGSVRRGVVSVVVVPHSAEPRPEPDLETLRQVRDFLGARAASEVRLIVLGPQYVRVSVTAEVAPREAYLGASVKVRCEERLTSFLHPVVGGERGRGWGLGVRPHESDLFAALEAVEGVGHVSSLSIQVEEDQPGLLDSLSFLISSGEHHIRIEG